jgi:membrane fusion protein (multidrug efflux system)
VKGGVLGRAAAVGAAIASAACRGQPPRASIAPTVAVVRVEVRVVPEIHEWLAQLDGSTTAEIRPQVSGYIRAVDYREGSRVLADQLLFTIDERPFTAAVEQARGRYENAVAELNKSKADVSRYTPLVADHAISREQLENARSAAQANEASVQAAKGNLELAQLNLAWAKVRSPIAGLVGVAQVRVGTLVNPNQVLTVVSNIDPMRASFNVRQQDYLRYAREINATSDGGADDVAGRLEFVLIGERRYPHRGRDMVVNREIEQTTGTLQVQALFPNPEGLLRPGLFGKVRLHGDSKLPMAVVPEQAVTQLQGRYQVIVVDPQRQVQVRPIQIAFLTGHLYAVESGLGAGEQVVVEGLQNALPGAKVNVVQAAWPPPADGGAPDGAADAAPASDARD